MEVQEEKKLREKREQLKVYEKGIETILDIKCSIFKEKGKRIELQDKLASKEI